METQLPGTPPAPAGQIPGQAVQNGGSPSNPSATDVYKAPQPDPGGSYEVDPPAPHLSSLPAESATRTADSAVAQPPKDDIFALEDTATSPGGNETSFGTGNLSAESNLSAVANSIQYVGYPAGGDADASNSRSAEGGLSPSTWNLECLAVVDQRQRSISRPILAISIVERSRPVWHRARTKHLGRLRPI